MYIYTNVLYTFHSLGSNIAYFSTSNSSCALTHTRSSRMCSESLHGKYHFLQQLQHIACTNMPYENVIFPLFSAAKRYDSSSWHLCRFTISMLLMLSIYVYLYIVHVHYIRISFIISTLPTAKPSSHNSTIRYGYTHIDRYAFSGALSTCIILCLHSIVYVCVCLCLYVQQLDSTRSVTAAATAATITKKSKQYCTIANSIKNKTHSIALSWLKHTNCVCVCTLYMQLQAFLYIQHAESERASAHMYENTNARTRQFKMVK